MGHTGGCNPRIMVHHSENYLSEKWAFCVYFVQLAWSEKPEPVGPKTEGRSLPYTPIEPRNDPPKAHLGNPWGTLRAGFPQSWCIIPKAIHRNYGHMLSIL